MMGKYRYMVNAKLAPVLTITLLTLSACAKPIDEQEALEAISCLEFLGHAQGAAYRHEIRYSQKFLLEQMGKIASYLPKLDTEVETWAQARIDQFLQRIDQAKLRGKEMAGEAMAHNWSRRLDLDRIRSCNKVMDGL